MWGAGCGVRGLQAAVEMIWRTREEKEGQMPQGQDNGTYKLNMAERRVLNSSSVTPSSLIRWSLLSPLTLHALI